VPIYQGYAQLIRSGYVPYRDFDVVYPPAALPIFVLPSYLPWGYSTSFAVVMGLCAAGCIAAVASALHALGAGRSRSAVAMFAIGLSPLVLGSLFDTRFDLWPTLLAVASLAAVLRRRARTFGVLAGLAFAAKFWSLAIAPIGFAYLWRRDGPRAALKAGALFLATAVACFLPFTVLAPGGVKHTVATQFYRPLEVESLGASILISAHHLGWYSATTEPSYGSQNLAGTAPNAVATVSSALELAALLAIWIAFARIRRPSTDSVVVASAAAVAAMIAFGKVFSPQYLIWLVPFVPLVRGRRGAAASLLLLLALGLTHAWFPAQFWSLALQYSQPYATFLLLRDLAILALAAVLVWPSGLEDRVLGRHASVRESLQPVRTQVE
jgi:uncharacterized membrane protein